MNPGSDSFQRAIRSKIYVDKTAMIKETNAVLGTEQCYVCVSRPRRFGKSMTANMLAAYYDKDCDSSEIFDGYKIAELDEEQSGYRKYLNQYDVIYLNMQDFISLLPTIDEALEFLQDEVIADLRKKYSDIVRNQERFLSMALNRIYEEKKTQFVFVIDEWDCILRDSKFSSDDHKKYLDFIRNLLKDKSYVALAYMTGILPVKKYGTHSALNMFYEYSMLEPENYASYIGFTDDEVIDICKGAQLSVEQMREWYDGYRYQNIGHIYNPRAVVEAALTKKFRNYWTKTETYEALRVYIDMNYDGLKDSIVQMISGAGVEINVDTFQNDMTTFKTKDDVLTLLVHLGYLGYDQIRNEVYIPNKEIRGEFKNAIEISNWSEVIEAMKESDRLLQATINMDAQYVAEKIDVVHSKNTSILAYNDENALSCVIALAYYNAMNDYTRIREMPTGLGFADLVYIPKKMVDKPAMVIELKYDKSAEGAIQQIKDKRYVESLRDYAGELLLVGINYDKETKKHTCIIERVDKQ